jgi:L-2-hydroxycarboxylate dehydrogenase (NAD+)
MSFTNASPLVATTRGKEPFFGTNPLSLAAPGIDGDHFVLDMSTSVVPLGKIEVAAMCGEKISVGWGINKDGLSITDPKELHALLPLGGHEDSSRVYLFAL